eukprot:1136334-Pelagomonas_calceolata.AAC.2
MFSRVENSIPLEPWAARNPSAADSQETSRLGSKVIMELMSMMRGPSPSTKRIIDGDGKRAHWARDVRGNAGADARAVPLAASLLSIPLVPRATKQHEQ